jgi:hypothetical protein
MHKGAAALLWGEPAASMRASAFCWRAACFRRGGNHPRPGLPLGETGKGDKIPCCRRPFWSLFHLKISLPKIDCRHHSLPRFYSHS